MYQMSQLKQGWLESIDVKKLWTVFAMFMLASSFFIYSPFSCPREILTFHFNLTKMEDFIFGKK